jgi:hypothetical protein
VISDTEKRSIGTAIMIFVGNEVKADLIKMNLSGDTKDEDIVDYVTKEAYAFMNRMGFAHQPVVDVEIISGVVGMKILWPEDEVLLQ